jgi:hypothetical protein
MRDEHHGGSLDFEYSTGGFDFILTSLNSSHSLVLLISPPAELGGRELERILGLSFFVIALRFVVRRDEFDRVGLGSRVLGLEYMGRGVLVAVSDRGLLVRRLAIPLRAPNGLDRPCMDQLGPASDESAIDPSVRVVLRGKSLKDGAEPGPAEGREDGIVRGALDVGRRRYRARLRDRFQIVLLSVKQEKNTHATALRAIFVLYVCNHFSSTLAKVTVYQEDYH